MSDLIRVRTYTIALGTALYQEQQRRKPAPADVLTQLEQSAAGQTGLKRFLRLPGLARASYVSGDLPKATAYSSELLAVVQAHPNWPTGEAIHHGNIVAGRIALQEGDLGGAIAFLLAAGQTHGSPALRTFGPNMALANDLLKRGENAAVLAYLNECRNFWTMENGSLSKWQAAIVAGKSPDFGANLRF